jgi:hypothetical protein
MSGEHQVPKASCVACPHRKSLLADGRCKPGHTCVMAVNGRQIERFVRTKPALAETYAGDAFRERRAISPLTTWCASMSPSACPSDGCFA